MSEAPKGSAPVRILIGLVAGFAVAIAWRAAAADSESLAKALAWTATNIAGPVGNIFLNLMFMVVVPLVFSSLALGVYGLGDLRTVGRLGAKLLAWTCVLSGSAVFIGMVLVHVIRPGEGLPEELRQSLLAESAEKQGATVETRIGQAKAAKSWAQTVTDSVTRNPFEDIANLFNPNPSYRGGGIISLMVFTVIVGVALMAVPEAHAQPMVRLLESVQALSMAIIGFAMKLAPFGVAALVFVTASKLGIAMTGPVGMFVVAVLGGLLIHMLGTYSLALLVARRRSPLAFFAAVQEAMVTAFSTSSSNATLPTSIRVAQENLGLPKASSSFVLTIGATGNQNGTALFEGITCLFLAQFYGIGLGIEQQLTVVLMSVLAGIGTAGVPGGSIPLIVLVLQSIGVPAEGIGIVLGVDRLLDMSRTVVNVTGDLVLATVTAEPEEALVPG
jgi:DAACS family dicarboxylate/amino acid:cation (Na+ or H+) symporter